MKRILSTIISLSALFLLNGCADPALQPDQGWEPGVHGFGVFDGVAEASKANIANNAKTFAVTGQANQKMDFKIRWVSLDNKLTVNKIEIYVRMLESYNDPEGNPKTADLSGNGKGKLLTTISNVAGNRQWNTFSMTPEQIYQLYKDASVKYDAAKAAVPVFNNPARPRPADARLRPAENATYGSKAAKVGTDTFIITWALTTTTGLRFDTFNPDSICGDPTPVSQANANCSLTTTVK